MTIKNKMVLFTVIVVICLAVQSYDNYTGRTSKLTLDSIHLLND